MKKLAILLLISLVFTSWATIFTGSKRNVLFESNPSGAKVYVNGFEKGVTPTQIKVKADDRIDFRLDNYKERVVVMDSNFNLVSIIKEREKILIKTTKTNASEIQRQLVF